MLTKIILSLTLVGCCSCSWLDRSSLKVYVNPHLSGWYFLRFVGDSTVSDSEVINVFMEAPNQLFTTKVNPGGRLNYRILDKQENDITAQITMASIEHVNDKDTSF